jgi:hypothetical protein
MEPHGVALVSRERLERPHGMRFWMERIRTTENNSHVQCCAVLCSAVWESSASRLGACERV